MNDAREKNNRVTRTDITSLTTFGGALSLSASLFAGETVSIATRPAIRNGDITGRIYSAKITNKTTEDSIPTDMMA
jgi:hypothetical protein